MRTSYRDQIESRIKRFKTNVFLDDILEKPRGKTLLIPVYEGEMVKNKLFNRVDQLVHKKLSQKSKMIGFIGKENELLSLSFFDFPYEEIIVFGLGKKKTFHLSVLQKSFATAIRSMNEKALSSATLSINSEVIRIDEERSHSYETIGRFLIEAFYLTQYSFDIYKSSEERQKKKEVSEVYFHLQLSSTVSNAKQALAQFQKGLVLGKLVSEGIYMTRDLVNEPASHMYPKTLAHIARTIARESAGAITFQVLDQKQCAKAGMGAFLAVAKGSDHEPQFIILQYKKLNIKNKKNSVNHESTQIKNICLIGKSITFDSGGLSLKPSEAMETMKIDMAGGATILGFFHTLSHLHGQRLFSPSCNIYGILPACENMPSGKAMRPGDIVTALNGKTIEVANTDAEGRLVLADALSYAEKYIKPDYIIDVATLTGAIIVALGDEMTGLFGNNQDFTACVLKSARTEGERIWEMPLYEDYLAYIKSNVADIKNVSSKRYGGAITAALFLQAFVSDHTKWAHLDIAGAGYNEAGVKDMRGKGATGWGIKTLIRLIYDCTKSL